MGDHKPRPVHGRGAADNPANRFERIRFHQEWSEWPEWEAEPEEVGPGDEARVETVYLEDASRSVIATNTSPDVGFDASLNPYRGCEHGCIYCYARPTHEYLGFSAGLDFESRILVKRDAPELLRKELASPRWTPQVLALSGVTDPYQPVERKLRITRRCLEVLAEARNPVAVITKSALVARDVDLLAELAQHDAVVVSLSITTLDPEVARTMEPRASHPRRRLEAIERLAEAGVPVGVMVAPILPGLTDPEIPRIIEAAAEAGAQHAGYTVLRLPGAVVGLVERWLEEHFPERKDRVLNRVRDLRGGRLNEPRFGHRMHGQGPIGEHIRSLFHASRRRYGLAERALELSTEAFRRPSADRDQLRLFE